MILDVDRDCALCPTCGNPLTTAAPGRHTGKFFRHCTDPTGRCQTTTVCLDPPSDYVGPRSHAVVIDDPQPTLPYETWRPMLPVSTVADAFDARMRQAGERE